MTRPVCTLAGALCLALAAPEVGAASAQETVLYNFANDPGDAACPVASLILASDGLFYGTSGIGGGSSGGSVFKVSPTGTENVVYSFGSNPTDGTAPWGR